MKFILKVISVIFICIINIKITIIVATYVGERLGFSKNLIGLWEKIKK